jgi:hypothetical protein
MDYKNLTAPCGRDCFNCPFYLAKTSENFCKVFARKLNTEPDKIKCGGCRNIKGDCQALKNYGFSGKCKIYKCSIEKNVDFCFECNDFPCKLLHPVADRGDKFPHNLKVYSLCQIKKLGLEEWAKNQAKGNFDYYYKGKLDDIME